jgi:uncharacterized membrane protein YgcG
MLGDDMKALKNNERGLSLVEVTIMLLVLMLLTGVLAPSVFDFVNDAKWVKVKEDCEAIGLSVMRLTRDVGPCLKLNGAGACTKDNRVELLHSDGPDVTADMLSGEAQTPVWNSNGYYTTHLNWDSAQGDTMENQFVINAGAYPVASGSQVGPLFGLGWRGAYLAPPIGSDPWGRQYLVNSAFLARTAGSTPSYSSDCSGDRRAGGSGSSSSDHGCGGGGGNNGGGGAGGNVFCISAGPNSLYETAFGGNTNGGVTRQGDDFLYIMGSAR